MASGRKRRVMGMGYVGKLEIRVRNAKQGSKMENQEMDETSARGFHAFSPFEFVSDFGFRISSFPLRLAR
jgi:hypothetical protein